jgi:hypothetical protein
MPSTKNHLRADPHLSGTLGEDVDALRREHADGATSAVRHIRELMERAPKASREGKAAMPRRSRVG